MNLTVCSTSFSLFQWWLVPAETHRSALFVSWSHFPSGIFNIQFSGPLRHLSSCIAVKLWADSCVSKYMREPQHCLHIMCTFYLFVIQSSYFKSSTQHLRRVGNKLFTRRYPDWLGILILIFFPMEPHNYFCLVFSWPGHHNSSGNACLTHLLSVIRLWSSSNNNDCFSAPFTG